MKESDYVLVQTLQHVRAACESARDSLCHIDDHNKQIMLAAISFLDVCRDNIAESIVIVEDK